VVAAHERLISGSNWGHLRLLAARSCTAVGDFIARTGAQMTLAEHWNGSAWFTQIEQLSITMSDELAAASPSIV